MTVQEYDTQVDLIVLDNVDFYVILDIDWLSYNHEVLVTLQISLPYPCQTNPRLCGRDLLVFKPMRIFFYVGYRRLVSIGFQASFYLYF